MSLNRWKLVVSVTSLVIAIPGVAVAQHVDCKIYTDVQKNSDADGCTSPGRELNEIGRVATWGDSSFTDDCFTHDRCFRTLGYNQKECDTLFLSDMRRTCLSDNGNAFPLRIIETAANCALPDWLSADDVSYHGGNDVLYQDDIQYQGVLQHRGGLRSIRSEFIRGAKRLDREYHRIDDNAKRARDEVVTSLVDGIDTVEGVFETIPEFHALFEYIGRPSALLNCAVETTSHFFNDIEDIVDIEAANPLNYSN